MSVVTNAAERRSSSACCLGLSVKPDFQRSSGVPLSLFIQKNLKVKGAMGTAAVTSGRRMYSSERVISAATPLYALTGADVH